MKRKRGNNEGSVYKRTNGTWRAQITLEGKRLSFTGKTKRQALEWMRNTTHKIENGLTFKTAKMTFGEYLDGWLQSKKPTLTAHTWQTYCQLVRDYIGPSLGKIGLQELGPSQIQHFYNQKVEEGIGLRTVQKTHTVIHAAFNAALKMGLVKRNPDTGTQPPKPSARELQFLNPEQVTRLLTVAQETNDRNYALYYIALVTGMRQGELLALKWNNVDLQKGILQIKFNLKRVSGGGLRLKQPKTKSSIRSIKLGTDSLNVLAQQKRTLSEEKSKSHGLWQDTGYVFPSTVGTAMDPTNLLRRFRQLLKRAKLPKIRFHDLRHTAASMMLNNGIDVLIASQRLGHAKPSITLDVYGHLMPSIQNEAAEVIDNLVSISK